MGIDFCDYDSTLYCIANTVIRIGLVQDCSNSIANTVTAVLHLAMDMAKQIEWLCLVVLGCGFPDSKYHGANMGLTWVPSAQDGSHVGPMNLFTRVGIGL